MKFSKVIKGLTSVGMLVTLNVAPILANADDTGNNSSDNSSSQSTATKDSGSSNSGSSDSSSSDNTQGQSDSSSQGSSDQSQDQSQSMTVDSVKGTLSKLKSMHAYLFDFAKDQDANTKGLKAFYLDGNSDNKGTLYTMDKVHTDKKDAQKKGNLKKDGDFTYKVKQNGDKVTIDVKSDKDNKDVPKSFELKKGYHGNIKGSDQTFDGYEATQTDHDGNKSDVKLVTPIPKFF